MNLLAYNGINRKLQADRTRERICESALELFSQEDFNGVSIDRIVKKAGVSKGSFYVHFSSRDQFITNLIKDYTEKIDAEYASYLEGLIDVKPAEEVIISFAEKMTEIITDYVGYNKIRALYRAQLAKAAGTHILFEYNRETSNMFLKILQKGIETGEFKKDIPTEIVTRHLMLAIRGSTYEWCVRWPDFDLKSEAVDHFKLILNGIKP